MGFFTPPVMYAEPGERMMWSDNRIVRCRVGHATFSLLNYANVMFLLVPLFYRATWKWVSSFRLFTRVVGQLLPWAGKRHLITSPSVPDETTPLELHMHSFFTTFYLKVPPKKPAHCLFISAVVRIALKRGRRYSLYNQLDTKWTWI